jgi:hypothetical protein
LDLIRLIFKYTYIGKDRLKTEKTWLGIYSEYTN